jgi:hypothetical protein
MRCGEERIRLSVKRFKRRAGKEIDSPGPLPETITR